MLEHLLLTGWKLYTNGSLLHHSNSGCFTVSLLKLLGLPVLDKHAVCLWSSGTWVLGGGLVYFLGLGAQLGG